MKRMKIFKYILTVFICLGSGSVGFAQYYLKQKSDSIALESDSVKLTIGEYRGMIDWQVSPDIVNWTSLNKTTDTLGIGIDSSAYYRATIIDGTCNPIISDTVFLLEKLTKTKSNQFTVDSLGGVFLLPSGIKVKIPYGAVDETRELSLDLISADSVNNLAAISISENTSFISGISLAMDSFNFRKTIKIKIPYQGSDESGIPMLYEFNNEINNWLFSAETFIVNPSKKYIEIILKSSSQNGMLKNGASSQDFFLKYFYLKHFNFPLPLKSFNAPLPEDPCREAGFTSESLDLSYDNSGGCVAASSKNSIIYHDCGSQAESFETTEISPECEPQLIVSPSGCIKIKKGKSATVQLDTRIGNIPLAYQTINVSTNDNNISVPSHLTTISDGNIPLKINGLEVGEASVSLTVAFDYFLSIMKAIGSGSSEESSYSNVLVSKDYSICVNVYDIPIVTTSFRTNNEDTRAFAGGEVTEDWEEEVKERGVYLDDLKLPNGKGLGVFEAELFDLLPNKTYTLKAYATNLAGTGFGEEIKFVLDVDGNIYRVVSIGTQDWITENLKTTRYNDGESIKHVTDRKEWSTLPGVNNSQDYGYYCWYNNELSNKYIYGAIYNYPTIQSNKLCPTGWHVPSADEYLTLVEYAGGADIAGGKLKEKGTTHWKYPNTGATNDYGLTALPGGYRRGYDWVLEDQGDFVGKGEDGVWFTSTIYSAGHYYVVVISYNYEDAGMLYAPSSNYGTCVRCVMDQE